MLATKEMILMCSRWLLLKAMSIFWDTVYFGGRRTDLVDWQRAVRGVVHPVTHHLPVWLLRLIPVDDGRGGAEHTTSDL